MRADVCSRARADLGVWVVAQVPLTKSASLKTLTKAQCCDLVPPWQSVSWHTHLLVSVAIGRHWKEAGRSLNQFLAFADGIWRPRKGAQSSTAWPAHRVTVAEPHCLTRWLLGEVKPASCLSCGAGLSMGVTLPPVFHLLLFCPRPPLASAWLSRLSL